jgi:hypothetical protein
MKKIVLFLSISTTLFACLGNESGAWADFKKCAGNDCVKEAVAVKDAFLQNPQKLLGEFQKTYEKGEDHVIGWLYILRDSVLVNSKVGTTETRFAMQQAVIAAAKPFENDPKVHEMAKSVIAELEILAIASELEDDIVEPSSDPITGTYAFDKGKDGGSGELQVSQTAFDKFKFKLSVFGGPPAHNQGFMEGEVALSPNNEAVFSLNEYGGECALQFAWGEGVVLKTLKGDPAVCGFGNNVTADGLYQRKSFADPFLSKTAAKTAANLLGEWQSVDDPKASVTIADGRYAEAYEGQDPMPPMRYIYYPVCPKDCNPVAKMPCLKIMGQDDVCYGIVKADGKSLEISQIGGTGNTNRYVKKQ